MKKIFLFLVAILTMTGAWAESSNTVTDVLNKDWTGVTGTSYMAMSNLTATSDAVYSVNCAGGNNAIQLRSSNNHSGIVTTTSGGKVKSVTVKWNSNTSNGRTLNVYGNNSAYIAPSDLYGENQGDKLGTIVCGTSTELEITGNYEYIGLRSASGAMYIDEIQIEWEPIVASGTCGAYGDNLTWELTGTQGNYTLTISGTGDMAGYNDNGDRPWENYRDDIKSIVIENGVLSIGNYAFSECTSLESVTFAEGSLMYRIGNKAFRKCLKLASIIIPASVLQIYDDAFSNCTGLTSVTFAEGSQLKQIYSCAFEDCGITSIELPASVKYIYMIAFHNCTNLTSVTIHATSQSLYEGDVFKGTSPNLKIYVPAASVDTYKAGWPDYADRIVAISTYALTTGTSEHCTLAFSVNDTEVEEAAEGDIVTVTATAEDGYLLNGITAEMVTDWGSAHARRAASTGPIDLGDVTLTPVTGTTNQWTFTMPDENVSVSSTVIRDMGYGVAVTVNGESTNGQTMPRFRVVKDSNDKYVLETALTYVLQDLLPDPQHPTTMATTDYSFVKLQRLGADGTTWTDLDNNAELIPGIYCATFTATDASTTYSGKTVSGEFELYAQFDITLTAGPGYEIDGTKASITTQEGQSAAVDVTGSIDQNGMLEDVKPGATVTIAAAEGYKLINFGATVPTSTTSIATVNQDGTVATFTMPENNVAISYSLKRDLTVQTTLKLFIDGEEVTEATRLRIKKDGNGGYEPVGELSITLIDAIEGKTFTSIQELLSVLIAPYFYQLQDDGETWEQVGIDAQTGLPEGVAPGKTYCMMLKAVARGSYVGKTNQTPAVTLFEGYEVEVPAGEYITYYKDEALYVEDADAALYTITAVGEMTATATEFDVIPANIPMLVKNNSQKAKTILLIPTENAPLNFMYYDGFKGCIDASTIPASSATSDNFSFNGLQFVWVKDAIETDANKCWLEIPTANATARTLNLVIANGANNNEGSFTITFKDNGTGSDGTVARTEIEDLVADGADYLESIEASKVFNAKKDMGIKLGTSSVNGSITLNLIETVKATKIVTTARKYNDSQHKLTVNGEEFDLGTGNDFADYELTFSTPTELSSIAFEATNKRAYILSVAVYYEIATAGGGGGTTLSDDEFELKTGTSEHGTIAFTVNDEKVEKAKEGDVVTVTVTSNKDYVPANVTGLWYAAIAAARGSQSVDLLTDIELTPVEGTDNQWTFTMQRANAEISATYWDFTDVIELLRQETELAKKLFKSFGDTKDDEMLEQMFKTIGAADVLLKKYDDGETVSTTDAYELLQALKAFNAQFDDVLTGISDNDREQITNNRYYDLNGRKLNAAPTAKGLYIKNGKVVVVK